MSLPIVTISAFPLLGQIGVLSDDQPSFRLTVTKDGSVYTPDTPIRIVLICDQSADAGQSTASLISGVLPTFIDLSAGTTTIDDLERNSGVTGSVSCGVTLDTSTADAAYAVGFPSSATVTVVGGSSPPLCDKPSCPSDTSDDLPFVSIVALESSIDSGEDAVFRVSSNRDLFLPLRVQYSCTTTLGVADSDEGFVTIAGGSGGSIVDISVPTNVSTSGYVSCSLVDDVSAYRVRSRTDSTAVGLLRLGDDVADPTLPTVSLIAYRTDQDSPISFSRRVTDAIVNSPNTYFGFVIDDPVSDFSDPFGTLQSSQNVLAGTPYLLHTTSFGVTVSVSHDLSLIFLDSNELTEQTVSRPWATALGFGEDRVVIEKDVERVLMRKGTGETVICGYDQSAVVCSTYRAADVVLQPLRVAVQCARDFSERGREREVFNTLLGGRYQRSDTLRYGVEVPDYIGDVDVNDPKGALPKGALPKGALYQFILPAGSYISADEQSILPLGTSPFLEADSSFSCEIIGGGSEDGYNVGIRQAAVRVYPRPVVSIEPEGSVGIGDTDPAGAPVATVPYGDRQYTFSEDSYFFEQTGLDRNASYVFDANASSSDVAGGILQSIGVGFLTSFGSCVGASVLSKGISAISDKLGFGDRSVPTKNENIDTKECSLDSAASEAVLEVLTAITRDYIVWAHEGFEDKPLFVKNPTTFYKNFHDDIIGRAIDRSGLGFLCNIGVGNLDAHTAKLRINLQQRYVGLDTVKPRCTYNKLSNNLSEFLDDVDAEYLGENLSAYLSGLHQFNFSGGIIGSVDPIYGGKRLLPSPKSDAGNQLDALSANLERTMQRVQDSKNILLSISEVDDEVGQAEQDLAASAKPGVQIFNPNDPTSIAAFTECTEAQNPEGDADCFLLNVSGSRITDAVGKALDGPFDRLLQVDEFGEIGQLVKLAVNATSAGLMKRYLKDGFGVTVGRETADILTDISNSSSSSSPYGSLSIGLGGMWWSAFFQDNGFYRDRLVSADLYLTDVFTLLQYLNFSFYPSAHEDAGAFPPTTPYNDFYTVHNDQTQISCTLFGPCKEGYPFFKNKSQDVLHSHFDYHIRNSGANDITNGGHDGRGRENILNPDGKQYGPRRIGVFGSIYPDGDGNEPAKKAREGMQREALERFKNAYRFLSNLAIRQQYHTFVDSLGDLGGFAGTGNPSAVSLYKYVSTGGTTYYWKRKFSNLHLRPSHYALPKLLQGLQRSFADNFEAHYPKDLDLIKDGVFHTGVCSFESRSASSPIGSCEKRRVGGPGSDSICVPVGSFNGSCEKQRVGGPDGDFRCVPVPGVSSDGRVCDLGSLSSNVNAIKVLRDIYDATLIAHIHLVGSVDEYDRDHSQLTDSPVYAYRSAVLFDKDHSSALERWQLVRDETFKRFRDGTMSVYLPLEEGEVESEYLDALGGCPLVADVIRVDHPTTYREYQRTNCILGTVFQDQAYFVVRRRQSGFPELLNKSLDVSLVCGYAHPSVSRDESDVEEEEQYQFAAIEGNLRQYSPITLYPNQDAVLFPVPKILPFFDSGDSDERLLRGDTVRCSIESVAYADGSGAVINVDGDKVTAVVEVSDHYSSARTFHSQVSAALKERSVSVIQNERINEIGTALFYVYLWGWYAGFVEMPYYSIQGLLSNPPIGTFGDVGEHAYLTLKNQEMLQRYRLLASLFADESEGRFSAEHFGFLTPPEAEKEYGNSYAGRLDAYFGRVLGGFLQELPPQYRQQ